MGVAYKDYYKILGVSKNATEQEIKSAYRKLAKKYHPDLNKAPGAEEHYKDVNEAYEVLHDPDKRKKYDTLGPDWEQAQRFGGAGGQGAYGNFNGFPGGIHMEFGGDGNGFSEFFQTIFGNMAGAGRTGGFNTGGFSADDLFRNARGRSRGYSSRGQDSEVQLTLNLSDILRAPTRHSITINDGRTTHTIEVNLPRGVRDGTRLKLRGQGVPGRNGGARGDLYVIIHIADDPRYEINGYDITTHVDVTPWDAALGGTVTVAAPDGPLKVKIPAGTQGGTRLRLHGRGLPMRGENLRGDLYAQIRITIPQHLSSREKDLWEQIRAIHS